jgi:diguanylate cyclase (GGDEF)-like protein
LKIEAPQNDENAALKAEIVVLNARISELETLADTDTLTPLANRRAFLRRLDHAIMDVGRHGTHIALVFIDLNSMKAVNDAHGHLAGDAVLKHVATHLQKNLRATDMVARIGGDEFGLILDHAEEDSVIIRMQRLASTLAAEPVRHGGNSFPVGLAWGVTMITGTDSVEGALARADAAMYAAKDAQRSDK